MESGRDQASEAEIQHLLAAVGDRAKFRTRLRQLHNRGVIISVLKRLEAEDDLDKLPHPEPYLLALADISDDLHEEERLWLTSSGAWWYVRRAVRRTLDCLEPAERSSLLDTLIRGSTTLFLPADWITDMSREDKEDSVYPKRTEEDLRPLKEAWLKRVRAAAKPPTKLLRIINMRYVLRLWSEWGGEDEVREWTLSFKSAAQLLDFVGAFVNKATSQGLGSAYVHDRSWIAWKAGLDQFGDQGHWTHILQRVNRSKNLTDQQKKTRALFQQTMMRWARGLQDNDLRKFEHLVEDATEAA